MASQPSPNERFDQVESTLEQLSNSFRHLLTAQVLINDAQKRAEKLMEQVAGLGIQTNQRIDRLMDIIESLAEHQKHTDSKIEALADSQKHTEEKLAGVADKLDALTDIVRKWYERHGNGASGQQPS
jgi:chromosome segregation ATPase